MGIGSSVMKRCCEDVSGDDDAGSFFKGEEFCGDDDVGSFCNEGHEEVVAMCSFPLRDFEEKLW